MTDMAITFGSLFLIQKIDFTNPQNAFYAQCTFGALQLATLLVYVYIYNKVNSKPNNTIVRVPTNPPSMFSRPDPNEPMTEQTTTEYDLAQLKKLFTQSLFSIGITVFLFIKMGIIQPMAMQSVMVPQNLFKNKLFKIYILGQPESKFPRPWVEESPFSMGQPAAEETPATEQIDNSNNITIPKAKDTKTSSSSSSSTTTTTKSRAKVTEINESESSSEESEKEEKTKKNKKKYL
ncbi:hypothetical protein ACTFIW_008188 [Dictyostelium discoideum]